MTDKGLMENAIARLTKENHFNNLIGNLPLFTILYGVQCALAHFVFSDIVNPGHFALALGASLIFLMSFIYIYDRFHHVIIYKNRLHIYFEPLKTSKDIMFEDIQEIYAPEQECEFASLRIQLKNKQVVDLHFIDYPLQVKQILKKFIANYHAEQEEKDQPINDLAA